MPLHLTAPGPLARAAGERHVVRRTRQDNEGALERRPTLPACAPQGANDDVVCVEREVQVAAQLPDVETPQVGRRGLRVGGSSSGEEGQDFDGLFEFGSEEILVVSVVKPPRPLAVDVVVRRLREANATGLQLDRSRLRMSVASTSRPASTSACDWARAACKAARSASSSQSPGSSGRSSISVPSGRFVGSSITRRPSRTRALIVIESA